MKARKEEGQHRFVNSVGCFSDESTDEQAPLLGANRTPQNYTSVNHSHERAAAGDNRSGHRSLSNLRQARMVASNRQHSTRPNDRTRTSERNRYHRLEGDNSTGQEEELLRR